MATRAHTAYHTQALIARWTTLWLIAFMVGLQYIGVVDPDGRFTAFIKDWIFPFMMTYIIIQFLETVNRDFTDARGFIVDNGLAILAVMTGVVILLLPYLRPGYILTWNQTHIYFQCLGWAAVDLLFGLLVSFRIAGSGKERDEEGSGAR